MLCQEILGNSWPDKDTAKNILLIALNCGTLHEKALRISILKLYSCYN